MPWTGERLRRARGRLGLTQDELRSRLGDLAPDGKQPSGTSISDWETDRTKPGTKWAAVLDKLFAEEVDSEEGLPPTGSSDVDLSQVDDLHLLAEVARRMAGGHRLPVGPMPGPRLRWSRSDLPSTRRAAETAPDSPDTRDARA